MLDLNLNFVNDDDTTAFRDVEESGTSNSSVVNADACISSNADAGDGDVEEDSSSAAGAGESFSCFNFDILKGGDTRCNSTYDEDDRKQRLSESELVTRRLFPVSRGEGSERLIQANSLLLCPKTNELQEIGVVEVQQKKPNVQHNLVGKKSRRGPRSRSSQYRGVTFYRRTGRWESHIWDCGKQVYLGGFDTAHSAARAYDRAAIKFRGVDADINFNISDYEEDMKQTVNFSKEEFVHILRRQTTGYTRGGSKYRRVTVHKCGEWEARMGQFLGKKPYDKDAIECNRREAVTNFEASNYKGKVLPTIDHGNNRDLNLSLGISTPSIGSDSSTNENIEQARLDYVHDTLRLQGNATNSRAMAGSSQGPPYWAWKLHGHNHIPTTTAASSGFSAPATTSGSHHLRETISVAPLNNPYSPLTAATSYAQYYHQTKPPPAPPP